MRSVLSYAAALVHNVLQRPAIEILDCDSRQSQYYCQLVSGLLRELAPFGRGRARRILPIFFAQYLELLFRLLNLHAPGEDFSFYLGVHHHLRQVYFYFVYEPTRDHNSCCQLMFVFCNATFHVGVCAPRWQLDGAICDGMVGTA
jgi:hypothetical protein